MKKELMRDISLRFPGGKAKALTFSYDDGVKFDERLVSVLNAHNMKGTFNLNSDFLGLDNWYLTKEKAREIYKGHEVSVHGSVHSSLADVPVARAVCEMIQDRINLENLFDTIVCGMAYPYGTYNDEVIAAAKNCGIVYSRTIESTHSFDLPENWLKLHPTCHHKDEKLMELADKFIEMKPNIRPQMFYLWGHSYEFDNDNNWEVIEKFADRTANHDDIWYATNMEIYNAVKAFNALVYNTECTKIYNPSAESVWISIKGEIIKEIPGGKTIEL